jgi:2-amino-4-hydroxy-6-hydroxymethyldihydropteridine diphosphokinase
MARTDFGDPAVAYIGLGSNLGDSRAAIESALAALSGLESTLALRSSSLYRSESIGAVGPDYLNAVVELRTRLDAVELLAALQQIEDAHARTRSYPNAPRTLDLDLLLVDNVIRETAELTLPHPRLHERAFVLVPLAEIAPELVHPGFEKTMPQLLHALPDQGDVDVFAAAGWDSGQD